MQAPRIPANPYWRKSVSDIAFQGRLAVGVYTLLWVLAGTPQHGVRTYDQDSSQILVALL
jgi:hypothetical protein